MSKRPLEDFSDRLPWADIDARFIRAFIAAARDEDMGGAGLVASRRPARPVDVTTDLMPAGALSGATLNARRDIVVCGMELIVPILEVYGGGVKFEALAKDGDRAGKGMPLGSFRGEVGTILRAERVMLNFLQKLSGIATITAKYAAALGNSPTRLLDTRKTTPGWRVLEKYAVGRGGGWNHRMGLFDRVMLKDNHLAAAGATGGTALLDAVRAARARYPEMVVQVEVDSMAQIPPVLDAGAHIVLLDNFSVPALREAAALIGDRARTEASGGITIETLPEIGTTGVDFASTGAITHGSVWVDIGLDWE
ncbi:MAG TPA: carboxylating nicotinate-nucleotide diphosphorylase [Opitutales bacterium]|nr:carboxylating nicotinate-nucleotide diphosphorylase [Opitutales bacterium]